MGVELGSGSGVLGFWGSDGASELHVMDNGLTELHNFMKG